MLQMYSAFETSPLITSRRLTLEREAGADLVAGLVQLLGIERAANAEGQTAVDLGVVGEGSNAEVVDLGLTTGEHRDNATQSTRFVGSHEKNAP